MRLDPSAESGLAVAKLIRTARQAGAEFHFRESTIADEVVRLGAEVQLDRSELLPFVRGMLYRLDLDCRPTGAAGDAWSIVPLPAAAPRVAPLRDARWVTHGRLEQAGGTNDRVVVAVVPLPQGVSGLSTVELRDRSPRGVQVAQLAGGDYAILQGPRRAVAAAWQKISAAPGDRGPVVAFAASVPKSASAAAQFELPLRSTAAVILGVALGENWRKVIEGQLQRAKSRATVAQFLSDIEGGFEPRVGLMLRPNRRSEKTKGSFRVAKPEPAAQWLLVLRRLPKPKRKDAGPFQRLTKLLLDNRRAFGVTKAFKIFFDKKRSQSAFEFAVPAISGTGCLAIGTVGERVFVSNSGPFIHKVVETAREQSSSARFHGRVFVDRKALPKLIRELGGRQAAELLERAELMDWLRLAFGS